MITIKNGTIEVCKHKVVYDDNFGTAILYLSDDTLDGFKTECEGNDYSYTVETLDVSSEMFLDGVRCTSLEQAYRWFEAGVVIEPPTLESIIEVLADIIGGAV